MLAPRAGKVKVRPLLQPWGYLYGLIWPSHTETIHSHLLLSSVTRVPLSKRETQRDVNRLERCIVHLQDECKLSLICELHASLALSKDLLTFGPRLSRCHLAWALAALLRPYRPYPLVPCAPVTVRQAGPLVSILARVRFQPATHTRS